MEHVKDDADDDDDDAGGADDDDDDDDHDDDDDDDDGGDDDDDDAMARASHNGLRICMSFFSRALSRNVCNRNSGILMIMTSTSNSENKKLTGVSPCM